MTDTTPRNQGAFDFLLNRRSRPYKTLEMPVPGSAELRDILTAAARTPDHGKLEPFRFIVLGGAAMTRLSQSAAERGRALGMDEQSIEKMRFQLDAAPLAVAVIASPKPSEKIPDIEQQHAAGAACLALLNAALASGWGANWLTGWAAHDRDFLRETLGLEPPETLVGWVHIGTARAVPPERPRPNLDQITTWIDT